MSIPFVHLRMHTEYSITQGILRIGDAVKRAVSEKMPALGITDLANVFGGVFFYMDTRKAGVKPVYGCDLWIENPSDIDNPSRLTVFCKNKAGYVCMNELLTRAWLKNHHRGRGYVKLEWLADPQLNQDLICLSAGPEGMIATDLLNDKAGEAEKLAQYLEKCFPDSFYLELQRAGRKGDERLVRLTVGLARRLGLPVVATHPIQFLNREDFQAHEARCAIADGYTLADPRRPRIYTEEQYMKSTAEMCELFADIPSALENTVEIARRCSFEHLLGKPQLPLFPTPNGVSLDDYMAQLAREGLAKRLEVAYPDKAERERVYPDYTKRLEYEIKTIQTMKFPGYFLIVQDFINWAKTHGCPVGPGRGSGAGSVVAWSLRITDLDPLHFGLLFERFLNPERISMPDFDVDFCQFNRDRVISYVKEKYGKDAVSQIATFGTMGAKGVIHDVGRVLDIPYSRCDALSKLIPNNPGKPLTLNDALTTIPEFKAEIDKNPELEQMMKLCLKLEGMTRNLGMHAGGVLIAPGKLTNFTPLYSSDGSEIQTISMYDKHGVEDTGLVKFDFLGLTTLTIMTIALNYIKELDGIDVDISHIPVDDQNVFEIYRSGNTGAVFQFESPGMRELLKQALPDRLEELVALNAMYRPGPMEQIPHFIARKKGEEPVEYLDKRLEPILGETYGIMVYQEQVMLVAQVIANYSLGGADMLRRAMGKKIEKEMVRHRGIFVEGATKNGVTAEVANELFDLMAKFASYGFNKSHAAAYAYVSYQTAWLKCYHLAAFMAANMCLVMDLSEKLHALIEDAEDNGVKTLAPDINRSIWYCKPTDRETILAGLGVIKGTGEAQINAIVAERSANGPFTDIFDFARRLPKGTINRRVLEQMVKAGAFDSIDADRGKLFANCGQALAAAEKAAADAGQASLFGDPGEDEHVVSWLEARPWSPKESLQAEREALGFSFSGNLFREYQAEARMLWHPVPLSALAPTRQDQNFCGIVTGVRFLNSKRGRMAVIEIDDSTASLEIMVFEEALNKYRPLFEADELLFVKGRKWVRRDSGKESVSASEFYSVGQLRQQRGARLEIRLADRRLDVAALKSCLQAFAPQETKGCRTGVRIVRSAYEGVVDLPGWTVNGSQDCVDELRKVEGVDSASYVY